VTVRRHSSYRARSGHGGLFAPDYRHCFRGELGRVAPGLELEPVISSVSVQGSHLAGSQDLAMGGSSGGLR
jgi:hypothetical protein